MLKRAAELHYHYHFYNPVSRTAAAPEPPTKRVRCPHNDAKYRKVMVAFADARGGGCALAASLPTRGLREVRDLLSASAAPVSAAYAIAIVNADVLPLPDDRVVVKYGITKDLRRRAGEHERAFGPRSFLLAYAPLPCDALRAAELRIRAFFIDRGWHVSTHPRHTELAVVPSAVVLAQRVLPRLYRDLLCPLDKTQHQST